MAEDLATPLLVLSGESPSFVVEALTAVTGELGLVAPFAVGYWGGRYCTRQSALSNFLRCSVHGGRESTARSRVLLRGDEQIPPSPHLQLLHCTTRDGSACARDQERARRDVGSRRVAAR